MRKTIDEHVKENPKGIRATLDQLRGFLIEGYTPLTYGGPFARRANQEYPNALDPEMTEFNVEPGVIVDNLMYLLVGIGPAINEPEKVEDLFVKHYAEHKDEVTMLFERAMVYSKRFIDFISRDFESVGMPKHEIDRRVTIYQAEREKARDYIENVIAKLE